jgi:hypothetical protein
LKYLFFVALLSLCFVVAKGQDTVKRSTPGERPAPLIIHSLNESPEDLILEHRQRDSIRKATQKPESSHPALYVDFGFGGAVGINGLQGNYSLNYQIDRSLFTVRGLGIETFRVKSTELTPISYFIFPETSGSLSQYAFLYGWRFTKYKQGFSFSAGISTNDRLINYIGSKSVHIETYYTGVPFEANYQWFTDRFGVSFGLKLSGDISQHSFVGFGVDMGLGFHKVHK